MLAVDVRDAADPTLRWAVNTTGYVYGSPAIAADGRTVYYGPSGDRRAYALDVASGAVVWARELCASDAGAQPALSADGAAMYALGAGSSNGETYVFALDAATGAPLWSPAATAGRGARYGTVDKAAALSIDGAGTVFSASQGALVGVEPASGNVTCSSARSGGLTSCRTS